MSEPNEHTEPSEHTELSEHSEDTKMSDSDSENEEKVPEKPCESSDSSFEEEEDEKKDLIPPDDAKTDGTETLVEIQSPLVEMTSHTGLTAAPPQPRRKRFIPKYEVEGTYRIILTEDAQTQIEMVVGSHVNAQYSWKSVFKSKIMEDIENRGESSEFFSLKQELDAYDDPLILMGYIPDESKDYEEFYICCTKEARDHCKQQSDRFIKRQEKKLLKAVQKKPGPWTSLGSEVEITELEPVYTRPLMEVEIKAAFPTLYDPVKLVVRDATDARDGYIELTPYRQRFVNVYRRRVDCAVQAGAPKVNREAQTVLRYPKNMWTQSIADALGQYDPLAGGDDKGIDDIDKDEDDESSSGDELGSKPPIDDVGLAAYKKAYARLRRPSYQTKVTKFVGQKVDEMSTILELNAVMDIYSNDYPNLAPPHVKDTRIYDSMTFEEYLCFTDVRAKDKYVACATFHPMWSGILAICYADSSPNVMKFLSTRPDPIQRAVYGLNPVFVWSHIDSLIPKLYLECTREVKVLAFCPFDENILVGGCVNGQVVVWDLHNKLVNVETIDILSEKREKYKIAVNAHMTWFKNVHDDAVVQATAMSNLATSHFGSINSICWLSPNFVVSNTGRQQLVEEGEKRSLMFYTGSEDGTILIWNLSTENVTYLDNKKVKKSKRVLRRPSGLTTDASPYQVLDRNLQPCYKIILGVAGKPQRLPIQTMSMISPVLRYIYTPNTAGTGRKYFRCEIDKQYEKDMSNIIYAGSQHGELRKVTFEGHAFNTGEMVNSEYTEMIYSCKIHDGIISSIQRNPFLDHLLLTVGGKIFAIWSDKLEKRPLIWKKRPFRLTDAKWSLYKPSLLFITTSEGNLETWDLFLRTDQPIAVQTVSGSLLTGVAVHTLPLAKNLIGASDSYGSFRMFINPPIFMISNPSYPSRMETMIHRELNVMQSFLDWQNEWMKNNPQILLEMRRKEGALLLEKEEEKRKKREAEEQRLEEEAEARRHEKMRIIGPAERWQKIIQKLIERTIAVKKRINRAELVENEKPLRELEAQRLEKEKRMLEIMKNQKTIFNDTVAILFPEAIKKPEKTKKDLLDNNKEKIKLEFLQDYQSIKAEAFRLVKDNPYKVTFSWEATLTEGKERRQALNAHEDYIKMHKNRMEDELKAPVYVPVKKVVEVEEEEDEEKKED